MKKRSKDGVSAKPAEINVTEVLGNMQHRLLLIESKIDNLIRQLAERPPAAPQAPRPFQHPGHHERHGQPQQENAFRDRVLHKAVCADCGKGCEVPFKPTGDRPVYCKECFSKRKDNNPFRSGRDDRNRAHGPSHAAPGQKRQPFYHKFAEQGHKPATAQGEKKKTPARKKRKSK